MRPLAFIQSITGLRVRAMEHTCLLLNRAGTRQSLCEELIKVGQGEPSQLSSVIDLPQQPEAPESGGDEDSGLVRFAKYELEKAGLFSPGSDYDGMLGDAVMDLIREFSKAGHSGCSAGLTLDIFGKLASYKPLTPITSDPDEWVDMSQYSDGPMWQNKRCPSAFSRDGGSTWYSIDDPSENNGDTWEAHR